MRVIAAGRSKGGDAKARMDVRAGMQGSWYPLGGTEEMLGRREIPASQKGPQTPEFAGQEISGSGK